MENYYPETPSEPTKIKSYKAVCAKLGFVFSVYFICRILNDFIAGLMLRMYRENYIGEDAFHAAYGIISMMLIYMVPILVAAILFGNFRENGAYRGRWGEIYRKPKRVAKALGVFPAMYGLGYGIAFLTIIGFYIITHASQNEIVQELFRPMAAGDNVHPNMVYAVMMLLMAVVAAPIFEEFLYRGIFYDALKPYGDGNAILITSIMFGLAHGRLYTLLYTTALGFALGYVRYATGSLWAATILHALINSVSGGVMFLMSLSEFAGGENKLINTVYAIFYAASIVLVFVGIAAFFMKIKVIKKYKPGNSWGEISGGKKFTLFIISIPVIISIVLAVDEHLNNILLGLMQK
ncbi:MAG: CPBP family intramembrane metalloprotease [Oscillospiraceae bacterium]|nr:CPBP family intramembrane metalloprotease [Oscillospiraceae bacterium]